MEQFDNYLSSAGQEFDKECEYILDISDDCSMGIGAVDVRLKYMESTEPQPEQ